MTNLPQGPTPPKGSMPKALEKMLLGGMMGLVEGFVEDVMGTGPKAAWGEVDVPQNKYMRREQIASRVLASLAGNVAAPLDQPDRLVSMAMDLTQKLMDRLDEEVKRDTSEFGELKKNIAEQVQELIKAKL